MTFSIDMIPALADNYISIVRDDSLGMAMVIDPSDAAVVKKYLDKNNLHLSLILNTHHHSDHVAGNAKLQHEFGAPVIGPFKEAHKIEGVTRKVEDGDMITFSDLRGHAIATPGHTDGHMAYYFPTLAAVFCGDALFSLGCGRVFEGAPHVLWESLKKIRELPDETMIYAGHEYTERNLKFALLIDPENPDLKKRAQQISELRHKDKPTLPVSLGVEKKTNPFLRVDDPAFQKMLAKAGFPIEGTPASSIFASLRVAKDRFAG